MRFVMLRLKIWAKSFAILQLTQHFVDSMNFVGTYIMQAESVLTSFFELVGKRVSGFFLLLESSWISLTQTNLFLYWEFVLRLFFRCQFCVCLLTGIWWLSLDTYKISSKLSKEKPKTQVPFFFCFPLHIVFLICLLAFNGDPMLACFAIHWWMLDFWSQRNSFFSNSRVCFQANDQACALLNAIWGWQEKGHSDI